MSVVRRAYVDRATIDAAVGGSSIELPAQAAHRFFTILRLPAGAVVEVFDGSGRVARGTLAPPSSLAVVVVVSDGHRLPPLVVAQAMTKTDKLELVVKKGTELGAAAFVLVACARSQVHLDGERADKRRERLKRVADDAARQSDRTTVPAIEGPVDVDELCRRVRAFDGVAVAGVVGAEVALTQVLAGKDAAGKLVHAGLLVVVGPEGGLDDTEAAKLAAAGAVAVRLGAHVLRTETAGLAALAAAQVALGHL